MSITNAARDLISTGVVTGTISPAFNNANAYIGVGDSATANPGPPNTFTDLQASTNKFKKPMDATYPQQATNVLTFRSTMALADANFAWNEWGVFNAGPAFATGTMLNRKQEALGTKASTQSWQFTVTLTMTAA